MDPGADARLHCHFRVGDEHRPPDPALDAQRVKHHVRAWCPAVQARWLDPPGVDVNPVRPVAERPGHHCGGAGRQLRPGAAEQCLHGGQVRSREQAEQSAWLAFRGVLGRRSARRQPHQVTEREAELVGAEPLRLVGEPVEDGLVQAGHRGEELGFGEGRFRDGGDGGLRVGGIVGLLRGLRRGEVLRGDRCLLPVRLVDHQPQRPVQVREPVQELGQLGGQENELRVRRQVRHEGKLRVRVEGRRLHRDAHPSSSVEQLGHHPAKGENGTSRLRRPEHRGRNLAAFGGYPHEHSH